jgi:hypothetical protein
MEIERVYLVNRRSIAKPGIVAINFENFELTAYRAVYAFQVTNQRV